MSKFVVKLRKLLIVPLVATLVVALLPFKASAATVDLTGNTANDATVTTSSGETIEPDKTNKWQDYNISWNFNIPNNVNIANGDTAQFGLPDGMTANGNLSFPVKNQNGDTIGNFTITQGATSGTLTFNDFYETHHQVNRHGQIWISANGVNDKQAGANDWNINKVSWIANNDEPYWNIAINAGTGYDHFVLEDTADASQTIIESSIKAQEGYYDGNGKFVPEKDLPIDATVDGNHMTLSFENIQGIVNITYQTTSDKKGTLSNKVTAVTHTGAQEHETTSTNWSDSAELTYDGGGNATGECSSSSSLSSESSSESSSVESSSSSIESSSASSSSTVSSSESSSSVASSSEVTKPSSSSVESSSASSSSIVSSSESSSSVASSSEVTKPSSSSVESSSASSSSTESSNESSSSVASSSEVTKPSSSSVESSNKTVTKKSSIVSLSNASNQAGKAENSSSNHSTPAENHSVSKGTGLPQTGEKNATAIILSGIILLIVAGNIIIKKQR